jgi:hypothetical protein
VLAAAREARALDRVSGKAAIVRPRETPGVRDVGHDGDDPGVGNAPRVDCIRDRLEIGAAAGEQDREAPQGRDLGFQGSESTPASLVRIDRIRSIPPPTGKERS